MKNLFKSIVIISTILSAHAIATPVVVDFADGSFTTIGQAIDTSYDITFSRNLYSGHPDGFYFHNTRKGAVNWYGERNEYITFANQVSLTSIDFAIHPGDTYIKSIKAKVYSSSDNLIDTISFTLSNSLQSVAFELDNVAKVVFDWVGQGVNNYNDGRDHNWYFMDNISYDTANNLYASTDIPSPAPLALLSLGLAGLGLSRFKKKA